MKTDRTLAHSHDIATKVAILFRKRAEFARDHAQRMTAAGSDDGIDELMTNPAAGAKLWTDWYSYAIDATQRSILFWDTIRQRGNDFVQHTQAACRRCCTSTTKSWSTAASSSVPSITRSCTLFLRKA